MRRWPWALSAVVVVLLLLAARHIDWHASVSVMRRASLATLAAAVLANGISLALRGVRWWIFLRGAGAESLMLATRGAIVGSGLNNLLVANGGDAARALLVARASGVSRTEGFATLALDRLFDPICFGLLVLVAAFVVPLPAAAYHVPFMVLTAVLLLAALLTALVWASIRSRHERAKGWRRHIHELRVRVGSLWTGRRFAGALLCSMAVWFFQVGEYALVARSLGVGVPVAGSVAAMIFVNAGLVLRLTPGSIGYFQFAYSVRGSHFGIRVNAAVAAALLIQIVEIVPVTLAALALAPGMARRPPPAAFDSPRGRCSIRLPRDIAHVDVASLG